MLNSTAWKLAIGRIYLPNFTAVQWLELAMKDLSIIKWHEGTFSNEILLDYGIILLLLLLLYNNFQELRIKEKHIHPCIHTYIHEQYVSAIVNEDTCWSPENAGAAIDTQAYAYLRLWKQASNQL